jgi:hypothetical protein
MLVFGAGAVYGTPRTDFSGATLATPTPVRLGILQEVSVDISRELKMLYGERGFPVGVGAGKGKISIKAKMGNFSAAAYGQLYSGRAPTTAIKLLQVDDPIVSAASVTTTPPSSGTFVSDLGIVEVSTGNSFKRVASAPATGEYTVTGSTYAFAVADNGKALLRNYEYSVASATGKSLYNLTNDIMGLVPTFKFASQTLYQGKRLVLQLDNCISGKFALPLKNDDFAIPDFEFEAFDNGTGTLGYMTIEEPS